MTVTRVREHGTPVVQKFVTEAGALNFVKKQMDGLAAEAHWSTAEDAYVPVARLRSDQEFLKQRLEERGIRVYVNAHTKRHISDMMVQAGMAEFKERFPTASEVIGDEEVEKTVLAIYKSMESKR